MVTQNELDIIEGNIREEILGERKNIRIHPPRCSECGRKPRDIVLRPK